MNFSLRIFFSACRVWTLRQTSAILDLSWLTRNEHVFQVKLCFLRAAFKRVFFWGTESLNFSIIISAAAEHFVDCRLTLPLWSAASRSVWAARELKRSSPRLPHTLAGLHVELARALHSGLLWGGRPAANGAAGSRCPTHFGATILTSRHLLGEGSRAMKRWGGCQPEPSSPC